MPRKLDSFYTPESVSKMLVRSLPRGFMPKSVADVAGGDGGLLLAAERKFPCAEYFYNDLDGAVAKSVRLRQPNWRVESFDFLKRSPGELANFGAKPFDLMLLNPPFSFRGKALVHAELEGIEVACSGAMAFVARCLSMLERDGVLVAILPLGCFSRRADELAWRTIEMYYKVAVVADLSSTAFSSVRASTRVVRIRRRRSPKYLDSSPRESVDASAGILSRGSFQMHQISKCPGEHPLVHSSELQTGSIRASKARVAWHRQLTGPAILFPRVGRVDKNKVCILEPGRVVVISDCVVAWTFPSLKDAKRAKSFITKNWAGFESLYSGTGAHFATMARVSAYLAAYKP